MRRRALVLAVTLLAAALAGCVGGDDGSGTETTSSSPEAPSGANETDEPNETGTADPREEDPAEDAGPNVTVTWTNATVQGRDVPDPLGWFCVQCVDNVVEFEVTNDTTGVVAQAFWDASVELALDLDTPPGPCELDGPADGDCQPDVRRGQSALEYRITDPQRLPSGEWDMEVWPENNPTEPVEATALVAVFEDGEVPRDWSRVPS